ncbi:transcription repressor OFP7-like [Salvia divinorum]|uniref:Transcription repressor n=1 Tax=Salvia divinorum TaxID=28513 RepID=A0ABD1IFP1_SALDI
MAKRFKLRICRAIATTLQSCRSKHPSNLPKDPVPSISHPRPHTSTVHTSIDNHPPQFKWQKEEKWHVVAKIHTSPAPPPSEKTRRRTKKKRNIPSRIRLSTSSADSGWFSSEGGGAAADEETETLVSSSPGSSSELHPIRETKAFTNPQRRSRRSRSSTKRAVVRATPVAEVETTTPARLSMFKKLIPCTVEGKVKESFAIVKKSENPLEDFKRSMMDMIVEKQMFEKKDLEQLLQCFLSLNSRNYHGIIVEAFSEIWTAMFAPAVGNHHHQRRRVSRVASF